MLDRRHTYTFSDHAIPIVFTVLLCVLPLFWIRVFTFDTFSLAPFHLMSALMLVTVVCHDGYRRATLEVLIVNRVFWLLAVFFVLAMSFSFLRLNPYFSLRDLTRQAYYIIVAIGVAAIVYRCIVERRTAYFGHVAYVVLALFLIAFIFSHVIAGGNPAKLLWQGIVNADPRIIMRDLYQTGFQYVGEDRTSLKANLRHEIFSALLSVLLFSLAFARSHGSSDGVLAGRVVPYTALTIGVLLILTSLSRSAALTLSTCFLLYQGIRFLTPGSQVRAFVMMFFVIMAVVVAALTPVGDLIWSKFVGETRSYSARVGNASYAMKIIEDSIWLGMLSGPSLRSNSHNALVDMWLAAGLFGFLVAFSIILTTIVTVLRLAFGTLRRTVADDERIDWLFLACLGVSPVVRWGTASEGQLSQSEWVSLGMLLGAVAARRRLSNREHRVMVAA